MAWEKPGRVATASDTDYKSLQDKSANGLTTTTSVHVDLFVGFSSD